MDDKVTIQYVIPTVAIQIIVDIVHEGIDDEVEIYQELSKRLNEMGIKTHYSSENNWKESNIRQWLNSQPFSEDAHNWWKPIEK